MFDMGFLELLVIAVIGLLVLGPERLPQVIKKLSSFMTKSRHFANNLKNEFEREANLSEMRDSLKQQKEELHSEFRGISEDLTVDLSTKPDAQLNTQKGASEPSSVETEQPNAAK